MISKVLPRILKPPIGVRVNPHHHFSKGLVGCWIFNEGRGSKTFSQTSPQIPLTFDGAVWSTGPFGRSIEFRGDITGSENIRAISSARINDIFQGGGTVISQFVRQSGGATQGRLVEKFKSVLSTDGGWSILSVPQASFGSNKEMQFIHGFTTTNGVWKTPSTGFFESTTLPHTIAVTYNRDATTNDPLIYSNGISIASITEDTTPSGSPDNDFEAQLVIGNREDEIRAWDGFINYMMLWDRILTPGEILSLYEDPYQMLDNGDKVGLMSSLFFVGTDYVETINDDLGVTDAEVKGESKPISDAMGLTDAVSNVGVFVRTVADALGITDAALKNEGKPISDSIGLTDDTTDLVVFVRSVADAMGITDSAQELATYVRTVADVLGITDLVSKNEAKPISDAMGITDDQTELTVFLRTVSDSLGLTDSPEDIVTYIRSISDSLGITDEAVQGSVITIADAIGLGDSLTRISTFVRILSENMGLSDSVSSGDAAKAVIIYLLLKSGR